MLNEKSGIWIKLYKLCIIIIFILCFPGCFFLGTLLRLTGFSYFCCIFLGLFVGILQWILNMLILNLVSNLQILREIEEKESPPPMLFSELVEVELPDEVRTEVEDLLKIKIHEPEIKKIPRVNRLNEIFLKEV